MRKLESIVAAIFLISPMAVEAELFDRGNGLVYDDELDVTWVQIADLAAGSIYDDGGGTFGDPLTDGLLTWASATAFVDNLVYAGFDDWRLPTMDANGDSIVVNCAVALQSDCLDNELGYLYYYSLGGTGGPLTGDTGPFTGILFRYWGSDEVAPSAAWTFDFVGGIQGPVDKNGDALGNPAGAWAVRSGDVIDTPVSAQTYRGEVTFPDVAYSETFFPVDPTTGMQIQVTCEGTSSVSYTDMVVTVSPPTMQFTINNSRTGVTGTDPRFCTDSDSSFPFQVANVTTTADGVSGQNNAGTLFVDLLFNPDKSELSGTVNNTGGFPGQQVGQASLFLSPTLIVDANGQLLGATDVDVNGTLYTVTFAKGNCIDEYDGCDELTDFDFDNQADAEAAANALANTVFVGAFDSDPSLQDGCDNFGGCGIFTPYGFSGQPPNVFLVVAAVYNFPDEADDEVAGFQTRVLDFELNFAQAWARWERQDPTPLLEVTVPADDCTVTAGGCNPTGLHEFTLPDGFVPPPGATITQTVYPFDDTRADAEGRCDGQTPQVLFGGDLIIPEYLCGSPEIRVIVTETNFDILEGTIFNTVFPGEFVSNPIDCNIPIVGDPQLQSAFVWQPTDSADVLEGTAIALTNGCGSSRGRVRGFSFIVVGLHIDFGLDFEADPQAVTQAFIDRASTDLNTLVAAVVNAQAALNDRDFRTLHNLASLAERLHNQGRYQAASRIIQVFLMQTDRISFDTSVGFNHEGNLLSRADHIRFLLDEFIVPF